MQDDFVARRAAHFESLYRSNPDPWAYKTSAYEQQKYRATVAAIPAQRFRAAIEIGCSIGVLTAMIAARADHVTGVDLSPEAIRLARERLADRGHVRLICGTIPADWPDGRWDLLLLSEVVYYLSAPEIDALCARIATSAMPGAHCILVNWTGDTGTAWHGPDAARHVIAQLLKRRELRQNERVCHGGFVIDSLVM